MFNESRKAGADRRYRDSPPSRRRTIWSELAESNGARRCSLPCSAKGAFPMDHPLYMGVHVGPISPPSNRSRRMDAADFVLNPRMPQNRHELRQTVRRNVIQEKTVWAGRSQGRGEVSHLHRRRIVREFSRRRAGCARSCGSIMRRFNTPTIFARLPARNRQAGQSQSDPRGRQRIPWPNKRELHCGSPSRADMLFGGPRHPECLTTTVIFAQGFYASMGFAVPAALGAPNRQRLFARS